jgi:creatinine amidohydrolase
LRRLAELSYLEARAALEKGAIALWPIGSTEAHGPHLPLDTDVIIASEICRRSAPSIAQRFSAEPLLLEPLAFTVTDFAAPFSGTISIPKATAIAYVRDVVLATAQLGFRAVCLVNGHLEPEHRYALRDAVNAAREGARCPLTLVDPSDRRFALTLSEEFKKSAHAGRYETSLVLASEAAARVDTKNFLEVGAADAYLGDPRAATPAEGHELYERLTQIVMTVLEEALKGE